MVYGLETSFMDASYRCDFDHSQSRSGSTPVTAILGLWEYSQKYYTRLAGVLPRVLPVHDFSVFGSTPRSAIPDLREYSHKSGIVPLGVLPDPLMFKIMHWEWS